MPGKQLPVLIPNDLGMGFFYLQPEEGKTYKANVTFADGAQNVIDLPQADIKGVALTINKS